jgi:hypothetical protein
MQQGTRNRPSPGVTVWGVGFTLLLVLAGGPGTSARSSDRSADRLPSGHEEPLSQYRAYRRMHAQNERFGHARLDGVRVPIATESIAKVRFAGISHFDVHYEYDTINGRPVSLTARRTPTPVTPR